MPARGVISRPPRGAESPLHRPKTWAISLHRLPVTVRVAAGRHSRVFQWAKCLPHVVEVTQRGVELLRVQGDLHLVRGCAFAAIAEVQDQQRNDYDGE